MFLATLTAAIKVGKLGGGRTKEDFKTANYVTNIYSIAKAIDAML